MEAGKESLTRDRVRDTTRQEIEHLKRENYELMQEGSRPRKDQQVGPADPLKAIEILLNRGFGRSPQQLDKAHSVCDSPLEHLADETLRLLVEKARQLKESGGVLVYGDGQIVTE